MPDHDRLDYLDPSIDPTNTYVLYNSDYYVLAYSDYAGSHKLMVRYGNSPEDAKPVGATLNGFPAMAVYNGVVHLTHQAADASNELWHMTYDGTTWSPDAVVPNIYLNESPGMAVFQGNLYVAHQGTDSSAHRLWYTVYRNGVWSQDKYIFDVLLNGSPSMAVFGDTLYLFHQGSDITGAAQQLWYTTTSDGKTWTADVKVPNVSMINSPGAAVMTNRPSYDGLYVTYHNAADSKIYYVKYDGSNWSNPTDVAGISVDSPISDHCSPTLSLSASNVLFANWCTTDAHSASELIAPPPPP